MHSSIWEENVRFAQKKPSSGQASEEVLCLINKHFSVEGSFFSLKRNRIKPARINLVTRVVIKGPNAVETDVP